MKIRGLAYIALLIISICAKLYIYYRFPQGDILKWLAYSGLFFDLIFYGILASLLNLLNESRWLVGLAWITWIACLIKDPLPALSYEFTHLSLTQITTYTYILIIPSAILAVSLLFARYGPAQHCLRWLSMVMVVCLPFLIRDITTHFPPKAQFLARLSLLVLQNAVLIDVILNTPALRSANNIDFP